MWKDTLNSKKYLYVINKYIYIYIYTVNIYYIIYISIYKNHWWNTCLCVTVQNILKITCDFHLAVQKLLARRSGIMTYLKWWFWAKPVDHIMTTSSCGIWNITNYAYSLHQNKLVCTGYCIGVIVCAVLYTCVSNNYVSKTDCA